MTSGSRIAGACLAVGAIGAGAFWLQSAIERSHESRFAAHVERIRGEHAAMDFQREALWGDTAEEAAWPHLLQLAEFGSWDGLSRARRATALHLLHRAAHARDARIPPRDVDLESDTYIDLEELEELICTRVMAAGSEEEQLAAIGTVLDLQQVCCDILSTPTRDMAQLAHVHVAVPTVLGIMGLIPAGHLCPAARLRWLEGLDQLCERYPDSPPGFSWLMPWHEMDADDRAHFFDEWSLDLPDVIDAMDAFERVRPRWEELLANGAPDLASRAEALEAEMALRSPAIVGLAFREHLSTLAPNWIIGRARLEFLRHALALSLGREDAPPFDPYGTGVNVERAGGRVRVWAESSRGGILTEVTL